MSFSLRRAGHASVAFLQISAVSLAGLLAIELALHLVPPRASYRTWHELSLTYLEDDEADWRLEPRPYPWGQVNRNGFRGREIPIPKQPGTCRVLVLGGSAAFDPWKPDGETWADLLEQRLGRALPCAVEVLNSGTPGYSTWQTSRLLRARLLTWQPDLVLFYELHGDSLTFRHADRQAIIDGWRLNGRANAIGWMAHPNPALDRVGTLLPRTVDLLRMRLVQVSTRSRLDESARFWWDQSLSGHVEPAALAFYEENLTTMARLLQTHGDIPFGIVTEATLIRERNTPEERRQIQYVYRGLNHEQLWAGYQAAWEINRKVAASEPNTFLIEAQRGVPPSLDLFRDEVHLTAAGSRLLAGVIAAGVLERFGSDAAASSPHPPEAHPLPPLRCLQGGS